MSGATAVIVGAGGVLGRALRAEFEGAGHRVFGLGRGDCGLQDAAAVTGAVAGIAQAHAVDVLICNAAQLTIAPFLELGPADFESSWRAGVMSAVGAARAVIPGMLRARAGTLLFTGATASLRGSANFAAFAVAKAGLRALAQSLAREYQPQGIHVAHVVLDGVLRGSRSAGRFQLGDERTLDPAEVARAYRYLAGQPRSAWTHELELRPASEKF